MNELRQANRSLEEKIARLCEAPFISDAFSQHEAKLKYEELLKERADMKAKIDHLQEAVRTHFSALTTMKQTAAQLREEKEKSDQKVEELQLSLRELQYGKNMLQDQLKVYSGDGGVDIETLERALTLVKRRGEAVERLPFLEDTDGESLLNVPILKRKLEECQHLNRKLTEENERLESMLKLQSGINKDIQKELELLVHTKQTDKLDLQLKADKFAELALKRLNKIHVLEAQVRQFVYGLAKNTSSKGRSAAAAGSQVGGLITSEQTMQDREVSNHLLAELINDGGEGGVKPDENIMEVWIKGAVIKEGILTPGSSSFIVIDFFDFESQTTSLLSGSTPHWDFAATYKLIVDDFLLRYLSTDVITLELNMVRVCRTSLQTPLNYSPISSFKG